LFYLYGNRGLAGNRNVVALSTVMGKGKGIVYNLFLHPDKSS